MFIVQYSTTKLSNNAPWTRKCKAWLLERTYFEISSNKNLCTSILVFCLVFTRKKDANGIDIMQMLKVQGLILYKKKRRRRLDRKLRLLPFVPFRSGRKSKTGGGGGHLDVLDRETAWVY